MLNMFFMLKNISQKYVQIYAHIYFYKYAQTDSQVYAQRYAVGQVGPVGLIWPVGLRVRQGWQVGEHHDVTDVLSRC